MPDEAANSLQRQFLAWQCLIRQYAIRNEDGRPPAGAKAALSYLDANGDQITESSPVVTVISKLDCDALTRQFRFIAQKERDPNVRREAALKHLAEAHYQQAASFSDQLTAVFALNSSRVSSWLRSEDVNLLFKQANQQYILPVSIRLSQEDESHFQFTYWHNLMFNPALPAKVDLVVFSPVWEKARYTKLTLADD